MQQYAGAKAAHPERYFLQVLFSGFQTLGDCLQCCTAHILLSPTTHMLPKMWAAVGNTEFFLGSLARSTDTSDQQGLSGSFHCRSPGTSPLMGRVDSKLFFSCLAVLLDDIIFINNIFYHAGAHGSQLAPAERGSELMAGVSRQGTSANEVIKD